MGSKSDYLEAKVLAHLLGATTYTPPATLYVALFTATPSDAGGGTEVTGGSYARVAIANNTTNWPAPTGTSPTTSANGTPITFPTPSASWGVATSFGIFDAANAGNLLWWGSLTANKTINNGDPAPSFATGTLTISED